MSPAAEPPGEQREQRERRQQREQREPRWPPPGTVTFLFQNVGHVTHDFSIDGKQTPLIQPGQTAKLAVAFTKNGKYPYLCTVPGHAEAGMKGVFTVG